MKRFAMLLTLTLALSGCALSTSAATTLSTTSTAVSVSTMTATTTYTLHRVYFLNVDGVDSDGRAAFLERTGQRTLGVPCMALISELGSFDPEATGLHLARGSSSGFAMIAQIEADKIPRWN